MGRENICELSSALSIWYVWYVWYQYFMHRPWTIVIPDLCLLINFQRDFRIYVLFWKYFFRISAKSTNSVRFNWLFVSLGYFVPNEDVTTTCEGLQIHTYTSNSVVRVFSVSHILWHRASDNNSHLRGPVTLTLVAERFAVELSLPVLTT